MLNDTAVKAFGEETVAGTFDAAEKAEVITNRKVSTSFFEVVIYVKTQYCFYAPLPPLSHEQLPVSPRTQRRLEGWGSMQESSLHGEEQDQNLAQQASQPSAVHECQSVRWEALSRTLPGGSRPRPPRLPRSQPSGRRTPHDMLSRKPRVKAQNQKQRKKPKTSLDPDLPRTLSLACQIEAPSSLSSQPLYTLKK